MRRRQRSEAELRAILATLPAKRRAAPEFARLRLAWIDSLDRALGSYPGAPPGTDLAAGTVRLRQQLRDYRDGFVAALNLFEGPR